MELLTGECVSTLKGHTNQVLSVTIIPDSFKIVSRSGDNNLKIWNYEEVNSRTLISFDY